MSTTERSAHGQTDDADVVDLLQAQHRDIKEQFERLMSAAMSDREDAFYELCRLLAVHDTAEKMIVHPALRGLGDDGERIAEDRLAEESHAEEDLVELEDVDVDHPEFLTRVVALRGDIVYHSEMEEQTEHPRLRDRLPAERLRSMATAVRAAEAAAPTPGSPLSHLVARPFESVADQVRGAIANVRP